MLNALTDLSIEVSKYAYSSFTQDMVECLKSSELTILQMQTTGGVNDAILCDSAADVLDALYRLGIYNSKRSIKAHMFVVCVAIVLYAQGSILFKTCLSSKYFDESFTDVKNVFGNMMDSTLDVPHSVGTNPVDLVYSWVFKDVCSAIAAMPLNTILCKAPKCLSREELWFAFLEVCSLLSLSKVFLSKQAVRANINAIALLTVLYMQREYLAKTRFLLLSGA